VTSILNFAPAVLAVPDGVEVRKVDLSIELQILAFHEQRKAAVAKGLRVGAGVTNLRRRAEDSRRQVPRHSARRTNLRGEEQSDLPEAVEA
jgi:redox-sensing transcriptional repressor